MTARNAVFVEGRKLMWDGRVYPSPDEAAKAKAAYEKDGFETWTCVEEQAFLVYTRRAVQQTTDQPESRR